VLIIDADMRLPMQGRYLGVEQGEGLSSMLSDSSIDPRSLIQNIQDNLDIIPAGPKPPDPAKLLNSSRCQEVVNSIRQLPGYDIVLWDAPPCLMLADPILLGEKLDGILFLVGLGKVSRELAPQACRRIKATGVDVLGLICNQVNFPSRLNDYGYEYGYYYHYAYAGAYGKNRRYGSYYGGGGGLKGYVKRYRDSYIGRGYRDSYLTKRYRNSYISNRYMRDGYVAQAGQEGATRDQSRPGSPAARSNGAANGSGKPTAPSSSSRALRSGPSGGGDTRGTSQPPAAERAKGWLASRLRFGRAETDRASSGTPDSQPGDSTGTPSKGKGSADPAQDGSPVDRNDA
jgi:Mrp family chromosome partitioning ATPase